MNSISFKNAAMEAGRLIVDVPPEHRGTVMHFLRNKKDRLYDLDIKEHREKRSLDANAYAWVLIHAIAKEIRTPPIEVYRQAVLSVGDNYTPMCIRTKDKNQFIKSWESKGDGWQCVDRGEANIRGCSTIFAYYGSSVFDTRQMSDLIDSLVQDCKALDIETLPPDKLSLLVEEWQ